ncbi:MAG: lmo0937 family membrane protein [Candidatus Brocadiia bacterium]
MMWTIAIVLLVLWLLGLITSNTFGGAIYVLLVVALAIVVFDVARRRR